MNARVSTARRVRRLGACAAWLMLTACGAAPPSARTRALVLEASTEAERWRAGLPVCPPEHSIAHGLVARSGLLVRDGEITTTLLRCEDRCECCNQWRGGYLALAQGGAPTLRLTGLGERAPSIFARHNAYDCEWRAWHHAALDRPVTVIGQLESDVLHALEVCEPSQD